MGNYNFELDLDSDNTMSIMISWIREGARILEFGPANGRLTRFLKEQKNCRVTIVEIDEASGRQAAAYAERSYVGEEEGNINLFHWYQETEKYDAIIFADVLEHLPNPGEVLVKCKDMLAPEGNILVSIPNVAHNSILIDLYNDRFDYDDVGLLDRTHVHFFTYHTFYDMIKEIGMSIVEQKAIISRVGWNEIDNAYEDVPAAVEEELRARASGSVYQYVFRLVTAADGSDGLTFADLKELAPDEKETEAGCFVWKDGEEEPQYSGQIYRLSKRQELAFAVPANPSRVRIDFAEDCAVVKFLGIWAQCAGEKVALTVKEHNAAAVCGDLYFFERDNSFVEPELEGVALDALESVTVAFQAYDFGMSDARKELYHEMIQGMSGGIRVPAEEQLTELKDYAAHLEHDIEEQKEYVGHLERDIDKQKEYVDHLEKDIDTQKEYIAHLEKDIAELKEYIEGRGKKKK